MRLDAELLKKTGVYAFVFSELVATIGGGAWLGILVDKRLQTAPGFTLGLATTGLFYSVWRIHRLSKHWMKK